MPEGKPYYLSDEDYADWRRRTQKLMRLTGVTEDMIAKAMGVTQSAVWAIFRRGKLKWMTLYAIMFVIQEYVSRLPELDPIRSEQVIDLWIGLNQDYGVFSEKHALISEGETNDAGADTRAGAGSGG